MAIKKADDPPKYKINTADPREKRKILDKGRKMLRSFQS